MDIKKLNEIDLKLHLLSGSDIKVGNLTIEPYTLAEIKDYGYTAYMKNLQWFSLTTDDFIDSTNDIKKREILELSKDNLRAFDFFIKLGGNEFKGALLEILAMVFKTDDIRILDANLIGINFVKNGFYSETENGFVVDEEKISSLDESDIQVVHRENFDDIVKVVNYQNYLAKPNHIEHEANPANEEVKQLMEQMEEMRKKVEAKKSAQRHNDEADIDIADIISAVSSKSNSISKINIWKLTLYQLYDEYSRLELIDNYDFSIRAIMTGAKKIELKHWSSKI